MKDRTNLLGKIYRLKLFAVATVLILGGLVIEVLGNALSEHDVNHLVVAVVNSLSDVLVVTGGLGIAIDFFTGEEREEADIERTRSVLKELTPDFTDAVLKGLAVHPEDLRRVATPELLDTIATNALALRLGDEQFAREIYADVRDQAIRAPERWYDVEVTVRLATAVASGTSGAARFVVVVEWEYTVIPSRSVARFACVSDRDEFYDLVTDVPATFAWYMTPRRGFEARNRDCFELLSFSVDGAERKIRRSEQKNGQVYSASMGEDAVRAHKPVRIRHAYRTIAAKENHQLYLEIGQPARDVALDVDYTNTDIAELRVSDLVTSIQKPQVWRSPQQVPARVLHVETPGWLLPRAGFTLTWTLASESSGDGATGLPSRQRSA